MARQFGDLSQREQIDYLFGEIDSMHCLFLALILTHPDLKELRRHWEGGMGLQEASTLPSPVPEAFIEGQQAIKGRLEALLRVGEAEIEARAAHAKSTDARGNG